MVKFSDSFIPPQCPSSFHDRLLLHSHSTFFQVFPPSINKAPAVRHSIRRKRHQQVLRFLIFNVSGTVWSWILWDSVDASKPCHWLLKANVSHHIKCLLGCPFLIIKPFRCHCPRLIELVKKCPFISLSPHSLGIWPSHSALKAVLFWLFYQNQHSQNRINQIMLPNLLIL